MNYDLHYDNLILRARSRISSLDLYYEKHHVVPKCMGGTNDKSNIVKLTPEEHYVAHQLLVKIFPGNYSLIHAAPCCVSMVWDIGQIIRFTDGLKDLMLKLKVNHRLVRNSDQIKRREDLHPLRVRKEDRPGILE